MMIVLADTAALLAGFVVFPMVFNYGLDMVGGAGLIFQTLPVAFKCRADISSQFYSSSCYRLLA